MKIAAIYTQSVGPLPDGEIRFENDWSGEIESNVLITGPNGCGKSTLLRAISLLWRAFGHWLGTGTRLNIKDESYTWFYRWDASCAMILDSFSPKSEDQIGLFLGSEAFFSTTKREIPTGLLARGNGKQNKGNNARDDRFYVIGTLFSSL
ncbi:spermidine/putrescine ABC transporter ATPase [Salmonella sp. NCTC 11881]|nr:spermidine/putrescine ABC transporter ATPase [Salmonella sp. NCTC 11881]